MQLCVSDSTLPNGAKRDFYFYLFYLSLQVVNYATDERVAQLALCLLPPAETRKGGQPALGMVATPESGISALYDVTKSRFGEPC